ncbi:MAG: metallophosphoesterase family protein [Chitinispirillaceae bacterium]|nr:metallophosphoesterase family protein [Chitinispirillaceae bacterium]
MEENGGKRCVQCGIVSDTHGVFRKKIGEIFRGVDHIFHAGDIGKPSVLREFEAIAPVTAVLGNVDIPAWYPELQKTAITDIAGKRIMVLHNSDDLDLDPGSAGIAVVIYGHTHKASARQKKGVWYINPGSAGPHRFFNPVTVAVMKIGEGIAVEHHSVQGD